MGNIYVTPMPATTVTNAGGNTDLMTWTAAADKVCKIKRIYVGQSSEVGDAQEESINLSLIRFPATVSGNDGTAGTIGKINDLDGTAGFAFKYNDTGVITTSGTAETLYEWGWNIRGTPFEIVFPDGSEPRFRGTGVTMAFRMQSTLADDATMEVTAEIEEE